MREQNLHKTSKVQKNNQWKLFHKNFNEIYFVSYIAGNLLLEEATLQFNNLLQAEPDLLAGFDQIGL